ncbi:MAG: LysR family transcriptional regulator [Janthinobacterium lividum]
MAVTFRQLRAFTAVATLGTFVDAARSVHVSPSALSMLIRDLEETLGFRLFERTTRSLKLSVAGRQYLPYAERILEDLGDAERRVLDLRNQMHGIVRVVTTQMLTWLLLPKAFAEFQRLNAGIRMLPVDVSVNDVLWTLEKGEADIAVYPTQNSNDIFLQTPLFDATVGLICPLTHRFAKRRRVKWQEILTEPLIIIGRENTRRIASEVNLGVDFLPAYEVKHTSTALGLVSAGLGLAVVADYIIRPMLAVNGLTMVPLVEPALTRQLSLYQSVNREFSPAAAAFRAFLLNYARENRRISLPTPRR